MNMFLLFKKKHSTYFGTSGFLFIDSNVQNGMRWVEKGKEFFFFLYKTFHQEGIIKKYELIGLWMHFQEWGKESSKKH
jgi:hypothetical protein